MRKLFFVLPLALSAACSDSNQYESTNGNGPSSGTVDAREKDDRAITASDQSNAKADLDHLAEIRKELVDASDLSTAAKNVKVMTRSGQVTLRGQVATEAERTRIEQIVDACVATLSVDNQITVNPQ